MAGQSSLREDLNILRRRAWEQRNQESQQYRDLYQESTPLFGEPYKTSKGDELSSLIQRMLGNYEDGNSCQYDGVVKDSPPAATTTAPPPSSSSSSSLSVPYGHSGRPHRDKIDSRFHDSSYGSPPPPVLGGNVSSQPSGYQSEFSLSRGKDAALDPSRRPADAWLDTRDFSTMPRVLADLTPPADPLSPLHSSESSDSERGGGGSGSGRPLSPVQSDEPPHRPQSAAEVSQADALPLASQTFPLPLSSKPNLANSRKPMALVRPMDGPEQVSSESPDPKATEDFHRQSYEGLSDMKTASRLGLPPLKMTTRAVEALSSDVHCVEDILREMTHSWPPLLTAIHTPSTTEVSKFSFPSKESHVHSGYQQPQKPRVSASPCVVDPGTCEDAGPVATAPSSGAESGSSSDSESSSGSESDSDSSENGESGIEESPHSSKSSRSPVKAEGTKDISWQLISWIKENQQNLNPQNHNDVAAGRDPKTATSTKPQPRSHPSEDSKSRSKRHYNSHIAPVQPPRFSIAATETSQLSSHKPAVSHGDAEAGPRKTVGTKHPGKGRKVPPLPEETQASLQVESVEVTPRDKDATFTDRPKVKTKALGKSGSKSAGRKQAKRGQLDRKEVEKTPPKVTITVAERKEAEPAPSPGPASQRPRSPPTKSRSGTSSMRTETLTPAKSSKKSRVCSSTREKKKKKKEEDSSRTLADASRPLLVKIALSQLFRVPQPPKLTKPCRVAGCQDAAPEKPAQEKETAAVGKGGKKRLAEKTQASLAKKKLKLEKESHPPSSSRQSSGNPQALKSAAEGKGKKSKNSKKVQPPLPHGSTQEQPKSAARKRPPEEDEESKSCSASKSRKKSSSKQAQRGKRDEKMVKSGTSFSESAATGVETLTRRPLLKTDDKQYSVDYHMKEAKKLKHKADATLDKMGKAFNYLDAAMSFVESGIAMETDPQTPKSAYTMFSETVDLIRFILKLKNYLDLSAPSSERDFLVLCMRCQALLQMAMFRCKRESALKYLRTLTDHFKNSKTMHAPSPCISKTSGTPSPMSPTPSPAGSSSSGPCSTPGSTTVPIPQNVQQMACSYVHITALFLSAHDTWEQADDLARRGSGLLNELDGTLGQLTLTSSMASLLRYVRQGLHWLRLDTSA